MRAAFFGSGGFGVLTLRAMVAGDHEIAGVFTRPDKPAGRGRGLAATPVKAAARDLRLPVHEIVRPGDGRTVHLLRELAVDVAVVVAYGHLLGAELLNLPRHGFLNLHASLLPAWRGAAPVPRALLAGDEKTGVTVFRLSPRFDEGDVLLQEETPIRPDDTTESLLARLSHVGARAMMSALGQLEAGWFSFRPQDHARMSMAPKFRKEDGRLDWRKSVVELERQVRAFQPWPLSFMVVPTRERLTRVNVFALECIPDVSDDAELPPVRGHGIRAAPATAVDAPAGTILWADDRRGLMIRCRDGAARVTRLKPEGRNEMTGAEFLRGARVTLGARLL
jgi:methionyl-tRNA formyltransferase